ncbi:MAG: dTMP kinase [Alphaproteobacteria bacterium]|nr:dTMP kinase [Alphaproteobacteria bacterium]
MTRGKFITLEGGEGAGKSTQVKHLADFLRGAGIDVVLTREVGGSFSAEAIRDLWLTQADGHWDAWTELLLIMAARREHLVKTVFPALDRGAWVISDRFADSTRAYQGIGLGLGVDTVNEVYRLIAKDFEPDLTLLLDLPVEIGFARVTKRCGPDDRYQQKNMDFHQKLREAYLALAQKYAQRFRVVDASRDANAVAAEIEKIVRGHFGLLISS